MARYETVDDTDADGREVDLSPRRGKPAPKPNTEFDELPNGTFRNDVGIDDAPRQRADDDADDDDESDDDTRGRSEDEDDGEDEDLRRETRRDREDRVSDVNLRKRLQRERRLREESDADAEFYRQRSDELDGRLRAIETKITSGETVGTLEAEKAKLAARLAAVRAALKAAKEAGDVDKDIELTEEIGKILGDVKLADYKIEEAKKAATAAAAKPVSNAPNRFLAKWKRQHGRFFAASAVNEAAIRAVDKEVAAAGFDMRSQAYYDEMDARLAKVFPKEFKRPGRTPRSPVNGGDADGAGRNVPGQRRQDANGVDLQVRGDRVTLTAKHEEIMRQFGLDPDSPDDVNTFVRENTSRKRR